MKWYEPIPADGRKSFYGKAIVYIDERGNEVLYSYNTPVMKRSKNGCLTRLWDGYSVTTGRHINAFCGINKSEYMKMGVRKKW